MIVDGFALFLFFELASPFLIVYIILSTVIQINNENVFLNRLSNILVIYFLS